MRSTASGSVPNRHYMYSAQVITQDLYPKIINTIRELAGGSSSCCRRRCTTSAIRQARGDHRQDTAVGNHVAGAAREIPRRRRGMRSARNSHRGIPSMRCSVPVPGSRLRAQLPDL